MTDEDVRKSYGAVDGNAWEGRNWKEDIPFATGQVYAVRLQHYGEGKGMFEVRDNLITMNTEKCGGRYEIYEQVEGQDYRRFIGKTWTAWGAKKKIARRVHELSTLLTAQILGEKLKQLNAL